MVAALRSATVPLDMSAELCAGMHSITNAAREPLGQSHAVGTKPELLWAPDYSL